MKRIAPIVALIFVAACAPATPKPSLVSAVQKPTVGEKVSGVDEGMHAYVAEAAAPVPVELEDKSKAQDLAKEAATRTAKTKILTYILSKRAHSGKTLADAEIPYIEVQTQIRDTVNAGEVKSTHWTDDQCTVTVSVAKEPITKILKSH
jgi:hypothetical protein